ncbi:MAG: restriction endonuclease subunit S [Bdellovibrionales bacterium]
MKNGSTALEWPTVKLKEICDAVNGKAFKSSEWKKSGLPIIRIQNLKDPAADFNYFQGDIEDKYKVEPGDVLFAWSGTPGTSFGAFIWNGPEGVLNQHIFNIRFDIAKVHRDYLFHALNRNVQDYIRQAQGGVGLAHITKSKFMDSEIFLPDMVIQRKVVEFIETNQSRVLAGERMIQSAENRLKRFRASSLKAACEGKLVQTSASIAEKKGVAQESAEDYLNRILAERRKNWETEYLADCKIAGKMPKDDKWKSKYKQPTGIDSSNLPSLPHGWCWAKVSQVGEVQLGRQRSPKHHSGKHMRPYLRVANVFEDRIDTDDVMEMNFTPAEFERYKLGSGDVLLNEGQSLELIGRPAIYRNEVPGACFQNTLVRFRAVKGVNPEYALIVFLSYMHNQRFQKIAKWTTNIAHLGAERFAELEFPLAPEKEQERIVAAWRKAAVQYERLKNTLRTNKRRALNLRRSILNLAFSNGRDPIHDAENARVVTHNSQMHAGGLR